MRFFILTLSGIVGSVFGGALAMHAAQTNNGFMALAGGYCFLSGYYLLARAWA